MIGVQSLDTISVILEAVRISAQVLTLIVIVLIWNSAGVDIVKRMKDSGKEKFVYQCYGIIIICVSKSLNREFFSSVISLFPYVYHVAVDGVRWGLEKMSVCQRCLYLAKLMTHYLCTDKRTKFTLKSSLMCKL